MPNLSNFSASLMREKQLRIHLRSSLTEFSRFALRPSGLEPAAHHLRLIEALEAVERGDCPRLMVLMPPGSAKSTYASVLFPAWFLARRRQADIIAASHTGSLARHFGRQVRALLLAHGRRLGIALDRAEAGATRFRTDAGGSYYAVGVRGPVTGRRADLLLIDDPVRGQADADSSKARAQLWEWYRADLATRLRPGAAAVLVMTRWHPDDLAGKLIAQGESWQVLRLPALAEADDPLGRAVGAPLWPEWEDAPALALKRLAVGERRWAALFQQRPVHGQMGLFAAAKFPVVSEPSDIVSVVRAWDLAATLGDVGDPDWTVGLKLGRTILGSFVILDVIRLRGGPAAVESAIKAAAQKDGPSVRIALPQDPGQAGRAQILYLVRQLAGFSVLATPETGSKAVRAMPVAAQAEAGNLLLLRGAWNAEFREELAMFPYGAKDDQVDALSRGFATLAGAAQPARRTTLPLMAR